MARLVANWKDGYANINADHIAENEGMIYAYNDKDELVGIFDLGIINYIYVIGGTNEKNV